MLRTGGWDVWSCFSSSHQVLAVVPTSPWDSGLVTKNLNPFRELLNHANGALLFLLPQKLKFFPQRLNDSRWIMCYRTATA